MIVLISMKALFQISFTISGSFSYLIFLALIRRAKMMPVNVVSIHCIKCVFKFFIFEGSLIMKVIYLCNLLFQIYR